MIKLGFTSKKVKKEERPILYKFPYLLMEAGPIEKGKVHKFRLEGEGIRELFNFTPRGNKLSYAQPEEDFTNFYLVNSSELSHDKEIKVNLDLSFNSKELFLRLMQQLKLDSNKVNCFKLELEIDESYNNLPTVKLIHVENLNEDNGTINENNENIIY